MSSEMELLDEPSSVELTAPILPVHDHAHHSSTLEKVLEHIFLGELLRCLWRRGVRDLEVLRSEVDRGGYDLVVECRGVTRHIQLKASYLGSKTARQKISLNLADKPSGCVVWLRFDPQTMQLGPFLWFGGSPGAPLPPLGDKIAKHTKGNHEGIKAGRPNIRIVPRQLFQDLPDMPALVQALFGV